MEVAPAQPVGVVQRRDGTCSITMYTVAGHMITPRTHTTTSRCVDRVVSGRVTALVSALTTTVPWRDVKESGVTGANVTCSDLTTTVCTCSLDPARYSWLGLYARWWKPTQLLWIYYFKYIMNILSRHMFLDKVFIKCYMARRWFKKLNLCIQFLYLFLYN